MANPIQRRLFRLRRRQLDETLEPLAALANARPPPKGWIFEIRHAIGMTSTQLAERLGISRPSLIDMENSEAQRSVTIKSLDRAADALNCRVVYALIPNGSLEEIVQTRARAVATKLVERISHSMALEDQKVSKRERDQQIEELADELVRELPKQLWQEK